MDQVTPIQVHSLLHEHWVQFRKGRAAVLGLFSIVLFFLLAVLGFNLLGDGLRDVLDPRMKE